MKKYAPLFLLTTAAFGAQKCDPIPPVACHEENCQTCHCLGPAQTIANAPVYPRTCNGDFVIEVAGLYWKAEQDGMEYAIDNAISVDIIEPLSRLGANNLIDADYKSPSFDWNFGFKLSLSYHMPCDGWDIGIYWTKYHGKASSHNETETSENHILVPIWSAFDSLFEQPSLATDISSNWRGDFSLIDLELGRKFWVSHYLTFRPHIGVRIAYLDQDYDISHRGGTWTFSINSPIRLNGLVEIKNNYKGVGVRSGLDLDWHLGCGFALYSHLAAAIVYGRFTVDHDENNRSAINALEKSKVLETKNQFHASRTMLDLALGLEWSTLFCDCRYGFTAKLGWEQHLFFHQNQMWRVNRINPRVGFGAAQENDFSQRRGTLSTQGWILSLRFEF